MDTEIHICSILLVVCLAGGVASKGKSNMRPVTRLEDEPTPGAILE